jgi:hypothetical protein
MYDRRGKRVGSARNMTTGAQIRSNLFVAPQRTDCEGRTESTRLFILYLSPRLFMWAAMRSSGLNTVAKGPIYFTDVKEVEESLLVI